MEYEQIRSDRRGEVQRDCWKIPEQAEAVAAFMEKRPPKFPPRSSA